MSISPWDDRADVTSPDGRFRAILQDARETAMGGPTCGTLQISNGIVLDGCSPSMVWSSDSRFLAVARWTRNRKQRLAFISMERGKVYYGVDDYDLLQLHRFDQDLLIGVDSPGYRPRPLEIDISAIRSMVASGEDPKVPPNCFF